MSVTASLIAESGSTGPASHHRAEPFPPSALPGRRGRSSVRLGWSLGFLVPGLLLFAWEGAGRFGLASSNLLPPPSTVAGAILDLAATGELALHVATTLQRVFLGFLTGALVGTILGALTGYAPVARRLVDPVLQSLRSVPSFAWIPLFILWFGIFESSKVALIAVGVFFPVYLNLMSGIEGVDRKLVEVGRVYNLGAAALIRRVLLPATLPAYVIGLRSGLGLGWMFVVAAEFMGASEGLGFLLVDGQMTGRPQIIIASILWFATLGKLTDFALARLGQRLLHWQDSFGAEGRRNGDADRRARFQTV